MRYYLRNGFLETCLRAIGNIFFCDNMVSGFLFLIATVFFNPTGSLYVILAVIASTLAAHAFHFNPELIRTGYYGYNAALVGFYWLYFKPTTLLSVLFLLLTAALTVLLMHGLFRLMVNSRLNLPPVSWASVTATWIMIPIMAKLRIAWPIYSLLPPGFKNAVAGAAEHGAAVVPHDWLSSLLPFLPVIVFFAAGLLVHSRLLALHMLLGLVLGLAVAFLVGGPNGWHWYEFYLILAAPLFAGLSSFFIVLSRASIVFAGSAVAVGLVVWGGLTYGCAALHVPIFTAPFAVTTTLFLLFVKLCPLRLITKRLFPVPLVLATKPELILAWRRKEQLGESFWRSLMTPTSAEEWNMRRTQRFQKAAELLFQARRIVVFTGAGISTESGIPDFRTEFIAWKKYDTRHFLFENFTTNEFSRQKYWEMSQDFYLIIRCAMPNAAHLALAELERIGPTSRLDVIITQNVDRLHQKAGNSPEKVIELHGNELTVSCLNCGKKYTREEIYQWILDGVKVPYCYVCQGFLKPDSVAFGQPMPYHLSKLSFDKATRCDLMIMIGSSLSVQPAALLPWKAKANGAKLIIVNLGATPYDEHADLIFREPAGKVLPSIIEKLKELTSYVQ